MSPARKVVARAKRLIVVPQRQAFEVPGSGPAFGKIYWRAGTTAFPSRDWEDFIVVVASWWCRELRTYERSGKPREFHFMDGPYFIRMSTLTKAAVKLEFCRRGLTTTEVLATSKVATYRVRTSIVDAATVLLARCRSASIRDNDVIALEKQLNKLTSGA